MTSFHAGLPQMGGNLFLTDGGLETTLIFREGLLLPHFAAFLLLDQPGGDKLLREYYRGYARIAERFNAGFVLETPTWRANQDWGTRLGYDRLALARVNQRGVELLRSMRSDLGIPSNRVVVSGCIGPRAEGHVPSGLMEPWAAQEYHAPQVRSLAGQEYHAPQVRSLAGAHVDMISAFTINYAEEAIGIVRAAEAAGAPVTISFAVEADGHLPTGQSLRSAIEAVDDATDGYPAYFQINGAHPSHFMNVLEEESDWTRRIRGIRANASSRSRSELQRAETLDMGDPTELGVQYAELKARHPHLSIFGGCCGTDLRHVERIAEACAPHFAGAA